MNTTFVNLTDYPINQPNTPLYQSLVADQRVLLADKGMINLPGFLTSVGIDHYKREIDDRMDVAYHAVTERHPYGYHRSDQFPMEHPRNSLTAAQTYRLAHHLLPETAIDELYRWPPMRQFIADITGNDVVYLSGDPSNGLVVQVYREGCGQAWHFDQALFSTILNLAESESGGVFECAPEIRTEDEPNYKEVKRVLDGESARVQKHYVKAGSFTIMLGRYTMHRVTTVEQQQPRISAVLSYELKPGLHMDLDTRKNSFGPTAPELPV